MDAAIMATIILDLQPPYQVNRYVFTCSENYFTQVNQLNKELCLIKLKVRQALFLVSVLTAKPVFVVSVLMAKPVFVVSV